MKDNIRTDCKYFFLPTQLIEYNDAVIIRRGVSQLKVSGGQASEVISIIMALSSEDGATVEEITNYFGQAHYEMIMTLLSDLVEKRFLVEEAYKEQMAGYSSGSGEMDVLTWNLGLEPATMEVLAEKKLRILGVNAVSHRLVEMLGQSGFKDLAVIDYPAFRNVSFFLPGGEPDTSRWGTTPLTGYQAWLDGLEFDNFDCLIATSDFGGMYEMRGFNRFCVENQINYLPVAVQGLKVYVGPIIIPGFTACFECLLQRQNTNLNDFEMKRVIELSDFEGQLVNAYHPAMPSIAASVAAVELFKFYGSISGLHNVGRVIEISLLNTEMKNKQVLKVPRCPVCSGIHSVSQTTVHENVFMPTHSE